jgi:hypothetical protein
MSGNVSNATVSVSSPVGTASPVTKQRIKMLGTVMDCALRMMVSISRSRATSQARCLRPLVQWPAQHHKT